MGLVFIKKVKEIALERWKKGVIDEFCGKNQFRNKERQEKWMSKDNFNE